jgi:hypothetical protein
MIFVEPMVTKTFLEAKPNVTIPVPVAKQHAVAGNHPSAYRVYWHEARREYRIALSGFAWRQ